MTSSEAKALLEKYWSLITDLRPDAIVQPKSILPKAAGTIKYAHFVYGEHLVQNSLMTDDLLKILMESFGLLDSYFVEEPDSTNAKYRDHIAGLKQGVITDFRLPNPFGETGPVNEYHNFIGQCFHDCGLGQMQHAALGTYIYKVVCDNAHAEKDWKKLLELADSPITRAIKLPDE